MGTTHIPVFFHLLADQSLQPGALLLDFSAGSQDALASIQALAGAAELAELGADIACWVTEKQLAELPASAWDALEKAGCKRLDDAALGHSDALQKPVLAASVVWLDGGWPEAPPAKPTSSQSASRALVLKLVQLVSADADTRDIEDIFRQDPTMSYHLLRLVNSPAMGLSRRITSFSQAILMLGRQQLRRWLNLMLFSARNDDYRTAMLLARVTLRARALELVAKQAGLDKSDQDLAFMTGMFSMLGVLFGLPLSEVFKPLQLNEALVGAVLRHEGELGTMLKLLEAYEKRDAAVVVSLLAGLGVSVENFNLISLQSCQWMLGIVRGSSGGDDD